VRVCGGATSNDYGANLPALTAHQQFKKLRLCSEMRTNATGTEGHKPNSDIWVGRVPLRQWPMTGIQAIPSAHNGCIEINCERP